MKPLDLSKNPNPDFEGEFNDALPFEFAPIPDGVFDARICQASLVLSTGKASISKNRGKFRPNMKSNPDIFRPLEGMTLLTDKGHELRLISFDPVKGDDLCYTFEIVRI